MNAGKHSASRLTYLPTVFCIDVPFSNLVASQRIFNPSRCDIKYHFSAKTRFILETVQTIIGALVHAPHTY